MAFAAGFRQYERYCPKCNERIGIEDPQIDGCPNCGFNFHAADGARLEFVLRCPECNGVITEARFDCGDCGAAISFPVKQDQGENL